MVTYTEYVMAHLEILFDELEEIQPYVIDPNVMLKNDGISFRCQCGCNVFHKYSDDTYGCNSCDLRYEAE